MDELLLDELINDMTEIFDHTAGETKHLAHHVREHLRRVRQKGRCYEALDN